MAEHNDLGERGEHEALLYLMNKGYTLHDKNWRNGHLEIDIVAEWWGEWVFVEVKTRRDEHFALAVDAVDKQKKSYLIAAAHSYMALHGLTGCPYRFDIITVIGQSRPFAITHIRDAYSECEVREEKRSCDEKIFKV